jgi:hypothetical protein
MGAYGPSKIPLKQSQNLCILENPQSNRIESGVISWFFTHTLCKESTMKLGLVLSVIAMFIPSYLWAQEDSTAASAVKREVFVTGGISYPYLPKQLDVNYKPGYNIGAGNSIIFPPGALGYSKVSFALEYSVFKFDEQGFINSVKNSNSSDTLILKNNPGLTAIQRPAKIFTAMVDYQGIFTVTDVVAPYFLIGAGFIYISVPPLLTTPTTTLEQDAYNHATIAWTFGLGVDVSISDSFGAFVQGKSVLGVLNETHQIFPISLGVRYTIQ